MRPKATSVFNAAYARRGKHKNKKKAPIPEKQNSGKDNSWMHSPTVTPYTMACLAPLCHLPAPPRGHALQLTPPQPDAATPPTSADTRAAPSAPQADDTALQTYTQTPSLSPFSSPVFSPFAAERSPALSPLPPPALGAPRQPSAPPAPAPSHWYALTGDPAHLSTATHAAEHADDADYSDIRDKGAFPWSKVHDQGRTPARFTIVRDEQQLAPSAGVLLDALTPSALGLLVHRLMLQGSVLVLSAETEKLVPACEALLAMLKPFTW
jgi:hypothetical protein